MEYYTDRTYTIEIIPEEVQTGCLIKTRNSDRSNTDRSYLKFSSGQAATVYVAHDERNALPEWLTSGFSNTGLVLETTDVPLTLWQTEMASGEMVLPGQAAGGSNYVVILR